MSAPDLRLVLIPDIAGIYNIRELSIITAWWRWKCSMMVNIFTAPLIYTNFAPLTPPAKVQNVFTPFIVFSYNSIDTYLIFEVEYRKMFLLPPYESKKCVPP